MRAWLEAFPSIESGRQLVIKAIEEQFDAAHWRRLVSLAEARPDVILIARELDNESMETLMASIDIVLSLARAEGFGLSLAEAMAHGKVVITTNYAAAPEYMDNSCAVLVECVEVPVVDPTLAAVDLAIRNDRVLNRRMASTIHHVQLRTAAQLSLSDALTDHHCW